MCVCVCVCVCVSSSALTSVAFVHRENAAKYSWAMKAKTFVAFSLKLLRCRDRPLLPLMAIIGSAILQKKTSSSDKDRSRCGAPYAIACKLSLLALRWSLRG